MVIGILFVLLPILLIVYLVRRMSKSGAASQSSSPLRSFFQYAILFAMMFVVATGLIGLLGRLINPPTFVAQDASALALSLSFVVVGVPVFLGVAVWTRRSFRADPHLPQEPLAAFFLTLASIFALISTLSNSIEALQGFISGNRFAGQALSNAIIWGLIWFGLWRLQTAIIPRENLKIQIFVGSLIGYISSVVGLVGVIGASISYLFGINKATFVSVGTRGITDSLIVVALSSLVWFHYWIRNSSKSTKDNLWFIYVLLAGVGGGLVMSVVAASAALYKTAVWFVGEPTSTNALVHFVGTPTSVGTVLVGLLAWWYHKSVLPAALDRNEINRIYDYLISGIGLISGAVGLSMILIATIEATIKSNVLVGGSAVNTLLAAGTLVIVGGPVWVLYWRNIQAEVTKSADQELVSPTRRIYLFILFGIGGIAAIVSLLVLVYRIFDDAFTDAIGMMTIRDVRYAIGVLVSTAIISAYHWAIYRQENRYEVKFGTRENSVLLIGPMNKELVRSVRQETGAQVTTLTRTDDTELIWPIERVISLIKDNTDEQIVILLDQTGLKIIPVKR